MVISAQAPSRKKSGFSGFQGVKQVLYRKSGDIEGFLPQRVLIDGHTMFFFVGKKYALRLDVSRTAVTSAVCGIGEHRVYQWLWETGLEILEKNKLAPKAHLFVTSDSVREGRLIVPLARLKPPPDLT